MGRNNQPEYDSQVALFEWSALQERKYPELKLLHASLNGVRLSIGSAMKAKRGGMRSGVPDVFLPVARGSFHGLFIEMKSAKGRPSKEQKEWLAALADQGYLTAVCHSAVEAIDTIRRYLEEIAEN